MDRDALKIVGSDEWWFDRLFKELHKREKRVDGTTRPRTQWYDVLWSWFEGDPPFAEHTEGWQAQVTRDVLRMGRTNFAQLGVVSMLDRVKIGGVRPVEVPAAGEPDPITKTLRRAIAQYKSHIARAMLYSCVMGEGYLWVGGINKRTGLPIVTAEDPRQCVTINDPLDPDRSEAALKIYRDDLDGYDYAIVARPPNTVDHEGVAVEVGSRVRVARRKTGANKLTTFNINAWEWVDELSGEFPIQDRGVFVYRITPMLEQGDFEANLDLLARINNMIVDRLWISKFQTFRQRAFEDHSKDIDGEDPFPDEDEETGEKINWDEILSADPGAVWRLPIGVKIWESTPTDIMSALVAVRDDVKEYAATNRTPLYVFTPESVGGSAEGASLAREQQVYKAEGWQEVATLPILNAMSDVLAIIQNDPSFDVELECQWLPAERFSLSHRTQSAAAAKAAGVPWEGRMEDYLQLPPETVQRYRSLRRSDLLFDQMTEQPPKVDDGADSAATS